MLIDALFVSTLVLIVALLVIVFVKRDRDTARLVAILARQHEKRPAWALPLCTVCGADACDHVREMPAREGPPGVAVEMKLGLDGVARGELIVEQ